MVDLKSPEAGRKAARRYGALRSRMEFERLETAALAHVDDWHGALW
jgi:hypothetical protein